MLLMIDNYDSFTYNLVQYFAELGADVAVYRNDEITLEKIEEMNPQHIVISPGPCTPNEAGISVPAIKQFAGRIPILGNLFRVRNTKKTKTNLMVFIRPRVLRTAEQAAIETNAKYNFLRNQQLEQNNGKVKLMPGEMRPTLPPLIGPTAPPTAPAPPSQDVAVEPNGPSE